MSGIRLQELAEIASSDSWEDCAVEQLGEEDELDYTHWAGAERMRRSYGADGTSIYVHLTQQLPNMTIEHLDVWRRPEGDEGWILRSYRVKVCEEVFEDGVEDGVVGGEEDGVDEGDGVADDGDGVVEGSGEA